MFWTIGGAVFIAMFCLTYGLMMAWTRWNRVKARAGNPAPMATTAMTATLLQPTGTASRLKKWSVDMLAYSGAWVLPDLNKISEMRKSLIQAGYRHPQAPAVYLGLRVVTAVVVTLPLLLFFVIRGEIGPATLLLALFISVVGFYLPTLVLELKRGRRQDRLDRALPDILDMFVIAMDAGLSLNAALHRVADEIHGIFDDFYDELQITAGELATGITWDEAFENLTKRTGVQSIRSMVSLMTQTGKLGGSIGDALRNHSEFTRMQRLLRAEERAAKLPVKMVFPMLCCIFPAIIIVIMGPGLIIIYDKFFNSGILSGLESAGGAF